MSMAANGVRCVGAPAARCEPVQIRASRQAGLPVQAIFLVQAAVVSAKAGAGWTAPGRQARSASDRQDGPDYATPPDSVRPSAAAAAFDVEKNRSTAARYPAFGSACGKRRRQAPATLRKAVPRPDANAFSAVKAALQSILGSAKSPAADDSWVPGRGKPVPERAAPMEAKTTGQSAPSAPGAAKPAAKQWPLPPRPVKAAGEATPAVVAPARGNINPSTPEPASGSSAAKPPISDATMLGKVAPASPPGRPAAGSGTPAQGTPGRVVLGAGEPEPPISGRPIDTLGPFAHGAKTDHAPQPARCPAA